MTVSYPDDNSFRTDDDQYMQTSPGSGSDFYHRRDSLSHIYAEKDQYHGNSMTESGTGLTHNLPNNRTHVEDAAADLLALRYLQQSEMPNTMSQVSVPPPGNRHVLLEVDRTHAVQHGIFDDRQDGIFLPGSVFQEFHSTLRDHLIYTARSNCPTRVCTPELQPPEHIFTERLVSRGEGEDIEPESTGHSRPPEITPQREYILWKTWIDELAPWLDKFDNNRHFEHKIPMMARKTPHLRNSILALSARQIEMKENSKSSSESLALYQEAIHLLLPELQSKDTAVIASCVILCVLEMMSCSPKEWRRHLEGCANLLEAVGINGFVGGVEEALFWCFARMDLCGALISQDITLIPVTRWASNVDFSSDIKLFQNPVNGFDTYANYAVFMCANCVAYLKAYKEWSLETRESRWLELVNLLEDWYLERPEEMKPILTISLLEGEIHRPFPTVLYGNGPAVSGNQLYHTAILLMLQERPGSLQIQRKLKSTFWHARQICAISESNTHHGAWTNSIQPIWIAGKVMSHPSEHEAILNILERIERETGWVTSWRREDLKAWWGDCDD
ncbi:fungal-specific transcription factor domain-containing protein [Leptodontidium sp. 2 PMI_412]|nr:fungal-specific transcription factor domain-containing protein [Leptodontidium sp. 2 PMI_412]